MWSFRGNACDLPTDCPTRERSGWTGDWQLYVETAAFLYDVRAFNRKFSWQGDLMNTYYVLGMAWFPDDRIAFLESPGPGARCFGG